ncbi:MAG: hypothetical protein ACRC3Z_09685 [Phocaeicola sp.]
MVVTGLNTGCFCPDMGDVILSEVTEDVIIDFVVYRGSDIIYTWSERYTPDDMAIIKVRNLGKTMFDFFQLLELLNVTTSLDAIFRQSVAIEGRVKDESGGMITAFGQTFYYCEQRVGTYLPEYNRFFNRYTQRKVRVGQFVPLYYRSEHSLKVGVAYYDKENVLYSFVTFADSGQYLQFQYRNLSPERVLKLLNEQQGISVSMADLLYYEAYLYDGAVLVDKIRFDIDTLYHKQLTHFLFYNLFGLPETIYLTGRDETAGEFKGAYGMINDIYEKIDTELNELHTVNSGYITEADYESIKDLVRSKELYRYEGGTMEKITITDVDITRERPRTTPLNVKLTYRIADEKGAPFSRPELFSDRIFDKSFDYTFN